jgi:asparagine synthase (glutamine-hydrolysing)
MCGINGIINRDSKNEYELGKALTEMNDLIIHRGPDDHGSYIDLSQNYSLGMGMRRLSIIDLTTGHQPMFSDNKSIAIVFNGEIYNYRGLRQKLISAGINFNTTSDTEVILRLYEQKGVDSFKELDGMFAFSLHDKIKNKLYITRDFFGEKPLYYTKTDTDFVFGSELKSLLHYLKYQPEICHKGLNLYFRLTYIPSPYTIFKNIYKLESNHFITYDLETHEFNIEKISDNEITPKRSINFKDAKEEVFNTVMKSVESRSVADVSLGTFLSGGVDSSIVSYCLSEISNKKIETFSIGFEKKSYDETDKSQVVAKLINSNHHEFIVKENDFEERVDQILLNFDEPFADSSALPTYLVSKHASDYVKVALTGDGGDEVFGGYNKYYMGRLNTKYTSLVPEGIHNKLEKSTRKLLYTKDDNRGKRFRFNRLLKAINYDGNQYWNIISLGFTNDENEQLFNKEYVLGSLFSEYKQKLNQHCPKTLTDFRMVDKNISLEGDMLVKVDRTSMLCSLECRAPFLNRDLWNLANSLPEKFLMNGWNKKYILKEAFSDYFPKGFLNKSKSGFGVPVGDWLRGSLSEELKSYIEPEFIESQGIFNVDYINTLVKDHINRKRDNSLRVWTFYVFQKWYKHTYLKLTR